MHVTAFSSACGHVFTGFVSDIVRPGTGDSVCVNECTCVNECSCACLLLPNLHTVIFVLESRFFVVAVVVVVLHVMSL